MAAQKPAPVAASAPNVVGNNANAATQMGYTAGALIDHMKQQGVSAPLPLQRDARAATMIAPELAMASTLASPGPGAPFTPPALAAPGQFAQTASPAPVHLPAFSAPVPSAPPASAFAPPNRSSAPSAPPAFAPPASAFAPPNRSSAPSSPPAFAAMVPTSAAVATTLADPMVSPLAGQKVGQRPDPTGAVPLAAANFGPAVFQPTSQPPRAALPMRLSTNADPFAKSLRLVMLVFGILCLLMFVTPVSASPLGFTFDMISGGEISALLVTLLPAIIGVIAILFSVIPMPTQVRGGIAAALMLAATIYPITLHGDPQWQQIMFVAPFLLVGGLMFRHAYPAAVSGRVVTTVGGLMLLAPLLVPVGGDLPMILMFKAAFAASGGALVIALMSLVPIVLAIVGMLLVWIPAPSLAGAKIIAWLLIMWGLVAALTKLIVIGHIADVVKAAPQASLLGWILSAAMLAIGGYGLAAAMSSRE